MKYSIGRLNILCLLGLCLLLLKTGPTEAQSKRPSRITSSRSFGTNVKPNTSNGPSFDCPEEFGYYPHPSDCTQYYVCVFGGALLESCTGGLMYSHDLQTCDWPRNVGCELVDTSAERSIAQSQAQNQREPHAQHVPSRVRFGAAFSSQGGTQKTVTVPPQYHRSPPQVIQAQVQNIPPPPPELRVSPNPVITSRGQPKPLIDSQEDIAKLYADAQESLPPVEEEESDRQQRVYRGQPSTVSQVQRDRDGIIHQASINSIPQTGKIGSYAFGTAYSESLQDDQTLELSHNRLHKSRQRKRRDLSAQRTEVSRKEPTAEKNHIDSNCSSEVLEHDSPIVLSVCTETSNSSNSSQERLNDDATAVSGMRKYSSKIRQLKSENAMEFDYEQIPGEESQLMEGYGDEDDVATGESKRRPRQLRPISHTSIKWPGQNYRAIDAHPSAQVPQQTGYSFGSYNPYLTPPNPVHNQPPYGNPNYNHLPGYHSYVHQQQQLASAGPLSQKNQKVAYTGYNLSLPPPPLEDDFRPIAGSYYEAAGAAQTSPRSPNNIQQNSNAGDLLPYLIQQLKELKEQRKHLQSDNFAYFRLNNQPVSPAPTQAVTPVPTISTTYYSQVDPSKFSQQVTPNGQYSTMGGFYNNQKPGQDSFNPNYPGKLVSQYSIASNGQESTTESNYFQYNIVANQKMKGVFSTAPPNQIGHSAVKVRPPVTPLQVTQSINVVSAPNLAYKIPNRLQSPFYDFSHLPVGISYASNSTIPESYQTFTKSVTTSKTLLTDVPTTTPKSKLTNFQFNINEFMANLKDSDLASVNPAVNPMIKYFKELSTDNNGNTKVSNPLVNRRPVTGSTKTLNSTATTTQVAITPNPAASKNRIRPEPTLPTQKTPTTMRALKGYENFIKSIQNQLNARNSSQSPVYSTSTTSMRTPTTTTIKSVDYYDEDYEEDEDIMPPSQMPPYMPMSETMAPPRRLLGTASPSTESPGKGRVNFQTGFLEATTTRRPFPSFTQVNQGSAEADVPSFISFPSDIFQELKQRLPKLPESSIPQSSSKVLTTPRSMRPTAHPRPTSSSTEQQSTRVRYTTIRPRIRGQQKWMTTLPVQEQKDINNHTENIPVVLSSSKQSNPGGLPLNSIHAGSSPERHRNSNRNRGSAMYSNQDRDLLSTPNRGTHPPRTRPTLKPSGTIVSKAQEFVDIYRYPPTRPDPIYPQPTPDKTAAKCRKDVCLLPDCYCGGKDIPGELPVESIPQIVLLTFDDSVNDLNKQLYTDLFEKGRVNPNGCPITATFYVSHEWTDYSQVQNLYADGHEMASHTVSHSFGEQFSQKKWTREIAGQREILAAYGGVKMSDVRGMRAPFLSVGGNKMYKMLYDSNFTYDSSMPVYENRPPSWPYTLDYKIFHDCMIPPCPTRSYPGVWQVPMVMWQDLNGGRCSMGDACSNPSDADGVTKMIMKNFERHYTTNRAPFGLFYHAAWFTQPHHKEGFIKFLDAINAMQDVWIITNWQALQWVRDPTPISRINSFQPFQCDYSDRPKRCNNPKVCNLWHKSGVRYMKTCQPCPDIYPWTGKSGIRSSRIDNEVEEPTP
ncbi:uncharacterized protein LOC6542325 isoform X5 [Drosophila erecta]|uniref:uncharacterized protein LOC6542325 isoform X5 n=1 Tax=Drosophila erecta TaxID=7220 RepID=UPI000F068DD8|nr:uncharacterized protein LOC6542325 isoform X5 [Drosophila erecta]